MEYLVGTGLDAASSGNFDLCLLKVALPGLDGYSIAHQLQKREIELPLVFLTGAPWREGEAMTANLRTKLAYAPKPNSKIGLIQMLAELLDGKGWLQQDA